MKRATEGVLRTEGVETVHSSVAARRVRRLLRDKVGMASIIVFLAIVIMAILAPILAPYDPLQLDLKHQLEPPSLRHLMGTDDMGRDILSRVLYGARISLSGVVMVVIIAVLLGTVVGTASGYLGGLADEVAMRITDIFLAFPSVVLAMAFAAALGPSVKNAALALGLVWWPSYARLLRGQILATKQAMYVQAARSLGANDVHLLRRHILPNCMDPVFVRLTMTAGYAILTLAGLSFIGLGAQPPAPEWGLMIAVARQYLYNAGWYPAVVGSVIFVTVISATLGADAIQDAFEPRLVGME